MSDLPAHGTRAATSSEIVHIQDPNGVVPLAVATAFAGIAFSTHIPLREDGSLVEGTIEEQARATVDSLRRGLEAVGSDLSRLLHVTVYLPDISDLAVVYEIFLETIPAPYPGLCAVGVQALAYESMKIEMTVIAATN